MRQGVEFGDAALRVVRADAERVAHAVKRIVAGDVGKVVLARSVDIVLDAEVEPLRLLDALAGGNAGHNAFGVDLGAATGSGSWLLGASPEVLLRKSGSVVTCHPYAGSAPRSPDPVVDRAAADGLFSSAKDLAEHAFVVDHLRDRLGHLCDDVDAPSTPQLQSTGEVWHLATPIRARLRDPATTALDLALLLGPTPAVCGTPSDVAAQIIREVEGERGFYAGAVGWCDAAGVPRPRIKVPGSVARAAGRVVERLWEIRPGADEPPMTEFLAEQMSTAHWFDQRRTRERLQWTPAVSIDEGFERLADWYRAHPVV